MQEADKVNNFSVIGIFVVTLINVFLSTFGGAPQGGGGTETSSITPALSEATTDGIGATDMTSASPIIYH